MHHTMMDYPYLWMVIYRRHSPHSIKDYNNLNLPFSFGQKVIYSLLSIGLPIPAGYNNAYFFFIHSLFFSNIALVILGSYPKLSAHTHHANISFGIHFELNP